jgi:phosphomannomutase
MSIYKAYDIRGIYGKELSESDAYLFGYYLIKNTNLEEIKIAHDLRLSYETLTKFLIQGILDANCNVNYLGKSSTPNFYFSLFKNVNSGIMITASHNPKEYNGFKTIIGGDSFDSRNGLYEIESLILEDKDNKKEFFNQIKPSLEGYSLNEFLEEREIKLNSKLGEYIDFLKNFYEIILTEQEKEVIQKLDINLDFSSGVSSLAVCHFLREEYITFKFYNDVPDGNFPIHSPDPIKAKDFIKSLNQKPFFSASFDGDGDRIIFYDEENELVLPDYIISLLIDYFISQKNNSFLCDLRVSKSLFDLCLEKKVQLNTMRVGRAFYKTFLDEHNSVFGAELSGHFFFRDFQNFDNPDIALIYILKIISKEILKDKTITFSKLIEKYKTYHKIQEENISVKNSKNILKNLKDNYKENIVSELDGLSLDFKTYWYNIRESNTEPVLKINFEGIEQKETIKQFEKLKKEIQNI